MAEKTTQAEARRIAYEAELEAEVARKKRDKAAQLANTIPAAEAEKQQRIIAAEALMEQQRREGLGEGERIKNEMLGRAEGMRAIFEANAEGIRKLVEASGGDANAAFLLMMADHVPTMMEIQAKAISNFKIDKVTV